MQRVGGNVGGGGNVGRGGNAGGRQQGWRQYGSRQRGSEAIGRREGNMGLTATCVGGNLGGGNVARRQRRSPWRQHEWRHLARDLLERQRRHVDRDPAFHDKGPAVNARAVHLQAHQWGQQRLLLVRILRQPAAHRGERGISITPVGPRATLGLFLQGESDCGRGQQAEVEKGSRCQ